MSDGLKASSTVEECTQLIRSDRDMCCRQGFRLRKSVAYSKKVMVTVPPAGCASGIRTSDLQHYMGISYGNSSKRSQVCRICHPTRSLRSLRGSNFVGAPRKLEETLKELDHGLIRDICFISHSHRR